MAQLCVRLCSFNRATAPSGKCASLNSRFHLVIFAIFGSSTMALPDTITGMHLLPEHITDVVVRRDQSIKGVDVRPRFSTSLCRFPDEFCVETLLCVQTNSSASSREHDRSIIGNWIWVHGQRGVDTFIGQICVLHISCNIVFFSVREFL